MATEKQQQKKVPLTRQSQRGRECWDAVAARRPTSLTLLHLLVCCLAFFVLRFCLGFFFFAPQEAFVHNLAVGISVCNHQMHKSVVDAALLTLRFWPGNSLVGVQELWCACGVEECPVPEC